MTLHIASAPNNVILRCYNSDICFQRELYKWLPCLTFFNDHWYLQNKVLTPWSKIYTLSGLPTLPSSSRGTCPWHIILLVGTDCSLTFHVPLMSLYTCILTSWNILLHCVHLAGSHSSFMTHFKHLLSGHLSLRPSQQAERSLPLLLSQAPSSYV